MAKDTIELQAGEQKAVHESGRFFRYLEGDAPVLVRFGDTGQELELDPGIGVRVPDGFDGLLIESRQAQTVTFAIWNAEILDNRSQGTSYLSGIESNTAKTAGISWPHFPFEASGFRKLNSYHFQDMKPGDLPTSKTIYTVPSGKVAVAWLQIGNYHHTDLSTDGTFMFIRVKAVGEENANMGELLWDPKGLPGTFLQPTQPVFLGEGDKVEYDADTDATDGSPQIAVSLHGYEVDA